MCISRITWTVMVPVCLSRLSIKLPSDYSEKTDISGFFPSSSPGLSWSFMEQPSALAAAGPGVGWETVAYLCHFQASLFSGNLANVQIPSGGIYGHRELLRASGLIHSVVQGKYMCVDFLSFCQSPLMFRYWLQHLGGRSKLIRFSRRTRKLRWNGLVSTLLILQWQLADGQQAKVKGAHA